VAHYERAPISEALIDIRIAPSAEVGLDQLAAVGIGEGGYPTRRDAFIFQAHVTGGQHVSASAAQQPIGHLFVSSDERQVFQVRLNGFTFSRLAPYESWSQLRDEARRLWSNYRKVLASATVSRVAVRYINRLDVPFATVELRDYLNTVPEVSPGLPHSALQGYFMQLQIPQPDIEGMLVINETLVPPLQPNEVSVILDIDLFHDEQHAPTEKEIWSRLEQFHSRKNEVFEACITDRTRELIR